MRIKLFKLSGISFGISAFILAFNYFFFHYFGENGFSNVFHKEAQKPFVSNLIGQLGVLFLFTSFPSITDESIAIHSIIQECVIDVNKKGVVGGAYTASFPTTTQPQQDPYTHVNETFIVDKNFGFIVSDSSDVIIFSGIVNNIQ